MNTWASTSFCGPCSVDLKPPVIGPDDDIAPGTVIIGFDAILPCSVEVCRGNIADSIGSNLPEAVEKRRLTVIANGPSARDVDLRRLHGPTLALNGAIGLFVEQGLAPTYWACCDPQGLVADFLPDNPPMETIYLVASKCHRRVFEKLRGRDVRLWHLKDHPAEGRARVALAPSITISASWLLHRMGFTDFDYWGWDGCFIDGHHHAAHAADWSHVEALLINFGGEVRGGEVLGGRTFATTKTWAAEKMGADQFFQLADYFGIGVTLHGDGMFRCAHEHMMNQP